MPAHLFIKICGITRLGDARTAIRAGANALGFVFTKSPRRISPRDASKITAHVHPAVRKIGVFVDSDVEEVIETVEKARLDGVQLQGNEPPEVFEDLRSLDPNLFLAKVIRVTGPDSVLEAKSYPADLIFLDRKDPNKPEEPSRTIPPAWLEGSGLERFVLAGGLSPSNVGRLIRAVKPWGVDVSSGVEIAPGKKDASKIRAFVSAVRRAEDAL